MRYVAGAVLLIAVFPFLILFDLLCLLPFGIGFLILDDCGTECPYGIYTVRRLVERVFD